jgi:hypothetical protein
VDGPTAGRGGDHTVAPWARRRPLAADVGARGRIPVTSPKSTKGAGPSPAIDPGIDFGGAIRMIRCSMADVTTTARVLRGTTLSSVVAGAPAAMAFLP